MKKALIIAILTLLPLSKLMAQAGQATLDSVKTTVFGLSSITTLYVTCTQANSYQLKFWIMGVMHTDGTYSSYSIQINGQPQAGDIVTFH